MWKIKTFISIISIFYLSFCGTLIFAATAYIDDDGYYYAQSSDQVPVWGLIIDSLSLVDSEGGETEIISSPTGVVNIADPGIAAGGIAGYFAENCPIPAAAYTQVHIKWGVQNTFRGCIYDPVIEGENKWRATPDGTLYGSKQDALANSSTLDSTFESSEEEYLPLASTVTVGEGETYTLKILWENFGLEAGIPSEGEPEGDFGVGLVWDPEEEEFKDGMLRDSYALEKQ